MAVEYFNAYHSYLKSIEPLNDAERGRLFTALLTYSSTGAEPELHGNERFIFPTMKEQIDRDRKRYEEYCEKQRANVAKRWENHIPTEYQKYHGKSGNTKDTNDKDKAKTKDKAKENTIDICADPETVSTPPVICLTLNTGKDYPIFQDAVDEWAKLYPAVDTMQELRKMRGWCNTHVAQRKTKNGIGRFINSWLAREQDKASTQSFKQPRSSNPFMEILREEQDGQN